MTWTAPNTWAGWELVTYQKWNAMLDANVKDLKASLEGHVIVMAHAISDTNDAINFGIQSISAANNQILSMIVDVNADQNDWVEYDVTLESGTWNLDIIHVKRSNYGIGTVSLDSSNIGTFDMYDVSGGLYNQIATISSINVSDAGTYKLRITIATKNASSSSYGMALTAFVFYK